MPRGDETGPTGQGPGTGRGRGRGRGRSGGFGAGTSGYCICPKCGERVTHQLGEACVGIQCLKCGAKMTRE